MRTTVFTLCVNGFAPEITAITFPLMERWCKKIGADFHVIEDRKYPELPCTMEKFQIYDLAQKTDSEWFMFFDADTLIHPDFYDVTWLVGKDTTISYGSDYVPDRFRPNKYFLRDGRFIGKGNWIGIASEWCLDYWHPLDCMTFEEAEKSITPTEEETRFGITAEHLVDDFTVSLNISRFGLKHVLIPQLYQHVATNRGGACPTHVWHHYTLSPEQKAVEMQRIMKTWGVKI